MAESDNVLSVRLAADLIAPIKLLKSTQKGEIARIVNEALRPVVLKYVSEEGIKQKLKDLEKLKKTLEENYILDCESENEIYRRHLETLERKHANVLCKLEADHIQEMSDVESAIRSWQSILSLDASDRVTETALEKLRDMVLKQPEYFTSEGVKKYLAWASSWMPLIRQAGFRTIEESYSWLYDEYRKTNRRPATDTPKEETKEKNARIRLWRIIPDKRQLWKTLDDFETWASSEDGQKLLSPCNFESTEEAHRWILENADRQISRW